MDKRPLIYSIRLLPRALTDIDEAAIRFESIEGEETSREWLVGLKASLAKIAHPRQHPVIPEARFFPGREIRQLVYRRKPYSVAYRVLFSVADQGPDGPTVRVFHVRHAARRPLTQSTARRLLPEE